jgi:hypothetical protein
VKPNCLLIAVFLTSHILEAQDHPLFYKRYPYGSQVNYSPFSVVTNGSYDILQVANRNNRIFFLPYAQGFRNVWQNISRPGNAIAQYGWSRFWRTEVFPTSLRFKNAQYWPNYQLHLIGGGITYVATAEWYHSHGFSCPQTLSAFTMAVYHFLNEAVENGSYAGPTVDPIADLLIFDPLGILLFSISGVPEFFSETLHAAHWSFQPLIHLQDRTLRNNGQNFSFKFNLPWSERWRIFYLTGMEGTLGLSYRHTDTDDITVGGGLSTRELVEVQDRTGVRTLTATLVWTAGFFYDRNSSLLASLILGGARGYAARLNVYPGLLDLLGLPCGWTLLLEKSGSVAVGVTVGGLPAGLGAQLLR